MDKALQVKAAQKLAQQLTSPNGRYEVGQQMLEPFREGRDYVAIGRKTLAVHHVEPGAPIWYDIDPQFSCTVVATRGAAPRVMDGQTFPRVEITPFSIYTLIRISVEEPVLRRFDVLDRAQVRAQAEMAEAEDTEVFSCLRTAATAGSGVDDGVTPPGTQTGAFSVATLATLFSTIEDYDVNVESLLMRATTWANFRGLLSSAPTMFDPITRRELLKTGYFGDFWNARVMISKKMQKSEILAVAPPEFVGVMPVRLDLSQMDAPQQEVLQYGWVIFEILGCAVLTNVGVARYVIS